MLLVSVLICCVCVCVRGFSTVASSFDGHEDDEEEVDDDRVNYRDRKPRSAISLSSS